ncbi:histidine kinase [Gryllotalpicola daejeonensis]|uniref:histidine kinase n=1 Tax=Gryllotalpicola daejeonensis TaxID=993087 RepID=A0ABP7ZJP5_9MICO
MNLTDRRVLPLALNAIGIVAVAVASFASTSVPRSGWFAVATVLALLTWAIVVPLQRVFVQSQRRSAVLRWVRRAATVVGVVAASLSVAPSNGIHLAPLAILVILAVSDDTESIWWGAALSALSFVLTPIGALSAGLGTAGVLGYLASNAVWLLIGVSRRQARAATRRNRELAEQQAATHEQEARASALAAREAVARDIHDVLAHSLGGLVIQLDAAEALLESGRTSDAQAKVAQARALAAEGLADARRAVAALRSPDDPDSSEQSPVDLAGAAERLLRAHRELGGEADARVDLAAAAAPLQASVANAFERALQEALSNARRHAPGEPVSVELTAGADRIDLAVSNRVVAGRTPSDLGGGHGLVGMAERFAQLPGGTVSATERDGRFVVSATASLAAG